MTENERNDIALFRYGTLAPLIQRQTEFERPWTYFRYAQNTKFEFLDGSYRTITPTTLARWYKMYQKNGFDGLKPVRRSDVGNYRKLDSDIKRLIDHYIDEYPRLPATQIYEKLLNGGDILRKDVSLSTINRYVQKYKKARNKIPITEKRRYEKENINEVWYGDTTHASYITIDGKKVKVYIIALIDDASRMVVGCEAFTEDNTVNLMKVLKSAVSKYGKPKLLSFDNGANYRSRQMTLLGARLGTAINYCPPYTPTSKSKIERFFRTLKDQYLCLIKPGDYHDLESYNEDLHQWIQSYNTRKHSSLEKEQTPTERFFSQGNLIYEVSQEDIDTIFLFEIERKVTSDGIVTIDGKQYEVDYHYQNQKILIRYAPDLSSVYVIDKDNDELKPLLLLDKKSNSHIRREKIRLSQEEEE